MIFSTTKLKKKKKKTEKKLKKIRDFKEILIQNTKKLELNLPNPVSKILKYRISKIKIIPNKKTREQSSKKQEFQ